MKHDDATRRAQQRRDWPIRKVSLAETGSDDLSSSTTVEERLGMMWRLALDAWAVSGRPLPDYRRSEMPGRVIRPAK